MMDKFKDAHSLRKTKKHKNKSKSKIKMSSLITNMSLVTGLSRTNASNELKLMKKHERLKNKDILSKPNCKPDMNTHTEMDKREQKVNLSDNSCWFESDIESSEININKEENRKQWKKAKKRKIKSAETSPVNCSFMANYKDFISQNPDTFINQSDEDTAFQCEVSSGDDETSLDQCIINIPSSTLTKHKHQHSASSPSSTLTKHKHQHSANSPSSTLTKHKHQHSANSPFRTITEHKHQHSANSPFSTITKHKHEHSASSPSSTLTKHKHQHSANSPSSNLTEHKHQHSANSPFRTITKHKHEHSANSLSSTEHKHQRSANSLSSTEHKHQRSENSLSSTENKHQHSENSLSSTENKHQRSGNSISSTEHKHQQSANSLSSSEHKHQRSANSLSSTEHKHRLSANSLSSTEHKHQRSANGISSTEHKHQHSANSLSSTEHQHSANSPSTEQQHIANSVSSTDHQYKHSPTLLEENVWENLETNIALAVSNMEEFQTDESSDNPVTGSLSEIEKSEIVNTSCANTLTTLLKSPVFEALEYSSRRQLAECFKDISPIKYPEVSPDINKCIGISSDELMNCENTSDHESFVNEPMQDKSVVRDSFSIIELSSSDEETDAPTTKYYTSTKTKLLVMSHPCKLYVKGKLNITPLLGEVRVLGHDLAMDKTYSVYSPRGSSLLFIESLQPKEYNDDFNPLILFDKLKNAGFVPSIVERIVTSVKQNEIVLRVENIMNPLTQLIEQHTSQKLFPAAANFKDANKWSNFEKQLQCRLLTPSLCTKPFTESIQWNKLNGLVNPKIVVCGGKNVGKSTFIRHFVNTKIQRSDVLWIDLDLGQPEFTISGTISAYRCTSSSPLLGPSYTHIKSDGFIMKQFMRETNVMECPEVYISSVANLFKVLFDDDTLKDMPWIVNTMGFSRNLGDDLNIRIIKIANPTHVVQINSKNDKMNFPNNLTTSYVSAFQHTFKFSLPNRDLNYEHISIQSEAEHNKSDWNMESKFLRELNVLGYFSNMISDFKCTFITDIVPYVVSLSELVIWTYDSIKPAMVLNSINGTLVALCTHNGDITGLDDQMGLRIMTTEPEIGLPCVGFGIVRGIDLSTKKLYLITPVSKANLRKVNCIAVTAQKLPPSLLISQGFHVSGHIPYTALPNENFLFTADVPKRSMFNLKQLLARKSENSSI